MFTILDYSEIVGKLSTMRNGAMTRFCYKSEVPVKADYKNRGFRILKIVETTCRFGVDYSNIASVIEKRANQSASTSGTRTNNFRWIIPNKASHNTNTGKDYAYFAILPKGHNTKVKYIMIDDKFNKTYYTGDSIDCIKDYVISSYWNRDGEAAAVRTVAFDNIIRINDLGTKMFE